MENNSSLPKFNWLTKLVLIVVLIVTIIMIIVYPYNFGRHFSDETAVWGQFGDYFNLVINIINTSAVLFLGYLVYIAQGKRDEWEKHYLAAQEKPLLRFIAWEGKSYRLYNMGKGPAHKVIIGKIQTDEKAISKPTYKGYSIPPNAYLDVSWSTSANALFAYYEGEKNDFYLVKSENDENVDMEKGEERDNLEIFLKTNAARKDKIVINSY